MRVSAGAGGMEIGNDICTHVHERAIVDAVGDDANSPVRDSGDSGLFLTGRVDYPCWYITLDRRRRGHPTCFDKQPEDDLLKEKRSSARVFRVSCVYRN